VGYSPWGRKGLDMTELLTHTHTHTHIIDLLNSTLFDKSP